MISRAADPDQKPVDQARLAAVKAEVEARARITETA